MSIPDAPATGNEACKFNREVAASGSTRYKGKCLVLAREARRIPALYPSALAAALATPKAERVPRIIDLRRGMVAYFDDPNDGNPYGHIVTIAGWNGKPTASGANLKVWSNDVVPGKPGAVGLVPATFFPQHWGDNFQFGATWLNGYNFRDLDAPAKPARGRETIGANLDHAIADIEKAIRNQRALKHTHAVAALVKDLAELKETRKRF